MTINSIVLNGVSVDVLVGSILTLGNHSFSGIDIGNFGSFQSLSCNITFSKTGFMGAGGDDMQAIFAETAVSSQSVPESHTWLLLVSSITLIYFRRRFR